MQVLEWDQRNAWISDYHPAGIQVQDAMDEIKRAITELGYEPRQRDNWYKLL